MTWLPTTSRRPFSSCTTRSTTPSTEERFAGDVVDRDDRIRTGREAGRRVDARAAGDEGNESGMRPDAGQEAAGLRTLTGRVIEEDQLGVAGGGEAEGLEDRAGAGDLTDGTVRQERGDAGSDDVRVMDDKRMGDRAWPASEAGQDRNRCLWPAGKRRHESHRRWDLVDERSVD